METKDTQVVDVSVEEATAEATAKAKAKAEADARARLAAEKRWKARRGPNDHSSFWS